MRDIVAMGSGAAQKMLQAFKNMVACGLVDPAFFDNNLLQEL